MNEKALQYAYELFQADGYTDSIDDFKNLIDTNPDAFNYSFELFKSDGYKDSVEDFATLLGVKKKRQSGRSHTKPYRRHYGFRLWGWWFGTIHVGR